MKPQELVQQYFAQIKIMQFATAVDNKPYLCTVHYSSDAEFNLYWCSLPTRRHSEEIAQNSQVAAYVLVHENTPQEDYVMGVTILGQAELLGPKVDAKIVKAYADKLGDKDPEFIKNAINGQSAYKFYRLKPTKIVLFDNKNFPDNPRQEWSPGSTSD